MNQFLIFTQPGGELIALRRDQIVGFEQADEHYRSYGNGKYKDTQCLIRLSNNTHVKVVEPFATCTEALGVTQPA